MLASKQAQNRRKIERESQTTERESSKIKREKPQKLAENSV